MNPSSNPLHLNSHHQEVIESGRNSVQDICTVPHSLNDINLSPVSIQHVSHLPEISTPTAQEAKRLNNFILDQGDRKQETLNRTKTRLPKINNPKAEDRLRALIELLGKKNPNIPQNEIHQNKRRKIGQEASVEETKKVNLVLPPLKSFTPKPVKQKEIDDMKKLFARSPSRKLIFKIPEAAESKESTQGIKLNPKLLAPIPAENPQSERNISAQVKERRKIIVRNYSHNTSVEKNSPNESGESAMYKKLVIRKAKKEKKDEKPNLMPLPELTVNFDMRVHKVSIDDALEKLIQLTNKSDNARKDLLKIQENALAIRLSYERNHKNFERAASKKESRNH